MYESFYDLPKRPFAAAPDADVLVVTPAVADAKERIDRCIRQGRGVVVLTAAAGLGKTQLCHRLARKWSAEFRVALLPNSGFPTRRGLLQAILAELGQPYQRLGETELRVELTVAARRMRTESRGVVLLLDEAHGYSERLLDEIRLIANLVADGEPLVRILLAGRPELEERLSAPESAGLNERIGELVSLPRLTADESRRYLRDRTEQAGGDLERLFTPEAIEFVVRAGDGVPRCLNQLADHALLLGYVAERPSVGLNLVREALDDLKRLPLQWHEPATNDPTQAGDDDDESEQADLPSGGPDDGVIEIGGLDEGFAEPTVPAIARPAPAIVQRSEPSRAFAPPATEPVADRFAQLDAVEDRRRWLEHLDGKEPRDSRSPRQHAVAATAIAPSKTSPPDPGAVLDRIEPLVRELLNASEDAMAGVVPNDADGRVEIERIVAALEAGALRGPQSESCSESTASSAPRSIHFSELRRRSRPT